MECSYERFIKIVAFSPFDYSEKATCTVLGSILFDVSVEQITKDIINEEKRLKNRETLAIRKY